MRMYDADEIKRLTLNINPLTHEKLQVLSKLAGQSMNKYVEYQINQRYNVLFGETPPSQVMESSAIILNKVGTNG